MRFKVVTLLHLPRRQTGCYMVAWFFCFLVFLMPLTVKAQNFDPNYIISDEEMEEYDSMGMFDIVKFIEDKGGTLYSQKFVDADGIMKSAAALIYDHSQENKINPRVLLVTLQKEQSLVDNANPTQYNFDWATGWAVCDGCSLSDPKVAKYKGFAKQIDGAAGGYRWYLEQFDSNNNTWLIWPNKSVTIDKQTVTPANRATASLYNYTPHLHGNENFNKIWTRWFALSYPDGSLLYVKGEPDVWLIKDGVRRTFKSLAVLKSRYNAENVLTVPKTDVEKYPIGAEIKFANYSLVRIPSGRIYLLVDEEKRGIVSMEVFRTLGFNIEEVDNVAEADLADYGEGAPITMESAYPSGALLQNKKTGGVFWVKDGVKRPVIDKSLLAINYKNYKIAPVAPDELEKYPSQPPALIKNGTLIRSKENPAVYVISDGTRRPIISPETFEKMGYKWNNVKVVPQNVVDLHEIGGNVEVSL